MTRRIRRFVVLVGALELLRNIRESGGEYRRMLAYWLASADLTYAEGLLTDRPQ